MQYHCLQLFLSATRMAVSPNSTNSNSSQHGSIRKWRAKPDADELNIDKLPDMRRWITFRSRLLQEVRPQNGASPSVLWEG